MTFGLPSWLRSTYPSLSYEVPIWYPTTEQPDYREWLVTNGLGGYASSTISGAHTRRYHGLLVSALKPPVDRHVVLSKVDAAVSIDGLEYELATSHWASGVVSPTGYKLLESFTTLPVPTWVYNLDGHYLIKQLCLPRASNSVHLAYFWLPDQDNPPQEVTIKLQFLTAFRGFHKEARGAAGKEYPQSFSDKGANIGLNGSDSRLFLSWNTGEYRVERQWWWGFHWPEEAARGLPDQEDLFLLGELVAPLVPDKPVNVCASLAEPAESPECQSVINQTIMRQRHLLAVADLPRTQEMNELVLGCDNYLVRRDVRGTPGLTILAGYPWFTDFGRDAMISLAGLTLSTRRYDEAREILRTWSSLLSDGLIPSRFPEHSEKAEYQAADTTLWWGWALYQLLQATRDESFLAEQYPLLRNAADHYLRGTRNGIRVDARDGLLTCGSPDAEMTWMDTRVATIPITPRSGKPVELSALWYNLLRTLIFFAKRLKEPIEDLEEMAQLTEKSIQKFWNNERQCLYDVLEPGQNPAAKPDDAVRPNQLFAISLPFRAFSQIQEKSILDTIDEELLTPFGLRSLSAQHPSYQGRYGCGLTRPDAYHRDISYHQGTVWPWLLGAYADALLNIFGPQPETYAKIRILFQPLMAHLSQAGCVGAISEIFDGDPPHQPRGAPAKAWSIAELMRSTASVIRKQ